MFSEVEEAIILEDDCLPIKSFFYFCQELLEKYRNDERIMDIGGTNILKEWKPDLHSYYFSHYGVIWGWATWSRAWKYYDFEMKNWKYAKARSCVKNLVVDDEQTYKREQIYNHIWASEKYTWDYQWSFARLFQSGLSIIPSKNLISNVGFGDEATHTTNVNDVRANLQNFELSFPLKHPKGLFVDREYDAQYFRKAFGTTNTINSFARRAMNRIKRSIFGQAI